MTLQELLDELNDLPTSARSAIVWIETGNFTDLDVDFVQYVGGEVRIKACEEDEDDDDR